MPDNPDLTVKLGDLKLQNPVMTASGTFGYAREFKNYVDLNRLGAIIVKGLSLKPAAGNPPPRIVETACGMINAIGLENVGIDAFIEQKLPFLKTLAPPIFTNIWGTKEEEYGQVAAIIDEIDAVSGIEVNISCPNIKAGGMAFGVDPQAAFSVVSLVRKNTTKFLMVKLSPNVTDIREIARQVEAAGADAISLINTLSAMAIDIETRRPRLANIVGGLSGPAIKPVALRMVWQVARVAKIPVIGIGGIMTATDALEFIIAGASAVQVGTANFVNPSATMDILDGIEEFMVENGIADLQELVGSLDTGHTT
ncbi:MAG: dihydroorotate dehydrogenase [Deltaproteobacteria bacterium]|jgi:dihydroorotate dehydrogenase (NAD+) catalytic subunit|nr:dihydroorotate dehydrogenase [Deltaproteobacteria bacterium]